MSIVLHHEPCRAIVQVDDAGNRILGRRAVNDRRPRRGVEDVQIVGGLLLARGHTAVHVEAAVKQVRCCRDGMPRLNKALPYMRAATSPRRRTCSLARMLWKRFFFAG